jgi:predicted amidohydrolase YtcJ
MQPEFLLRIGHAYRRQLGEKTAARLKRARSFLDAKVRLSFNSDRPIVGGNPWDGIRTAVQRPEGFDQSENVTLHEAVRLYTEGGADANGDQATMGRIEEGKFADFQVYEKGLSDADGPDAVYLGGEPTFSRTLVKGS